jgi:hypothetical protein
MMTDIRLLPKAKQADGRAYECPQVEIDKTSTMNLCRHLLDPVFFAGPQLNIIPKILMYE